MCQPGTILRAWDICVIDIKTLRHFVVSTWYYILNPLVIIESVGNNDRKDLELLG